MPNRLKFRELHGIKIASCSTGLSMGRLTPMGCAFRINGSTYQVYSCKCGNTYVAQSHKIAIGLIVSCGCFQKENMSKVKTTHGMSGTTIWQCWCAIKARCYNSSNAGYHNYGGRGIKVCERWQSFENFYADMGDRPSDEHSIERVDNEGDYEPSNCVWATMLEQSNNTRWNVNLNIDDVTRTAMEWSRISGVSVNTIYGRLYRGVSPEEAVWKGSHQNNAYCFD